MRDSFDPDRKRKERSRRVRISEVMEKREVRSMSLFSNTFESRTCRTSQPSTDMQFGLRPFDVEYN